MIPKLHKSDAKPTYPVPNMSNYFWVRPTKTNLPCSTSGATYCAEPQLVINNWPGVVELLRPTQRKGKQRCVMLCGRHIKKTCTSSQFRCHSYQSLLTSNFLCRLRVSFQALSPVILLLSVDREERSSKRCNCVPTTTWQRQEKHKTGRLRLPASVQLASYPMNDHVSMAILQSWN